MTIALSNGCPLVSLTTPRSVECSWAAAGRGMVAAAIGEHRRIARALGAYDDIMGRLSETLCAA